MKIRSEELQQMFGDDVEIFHEVLDDFCDSYKENLTKLSKAIGARSASELEICAHTLKGVLSIFCSTIAMEIAGDMEQMGYAASFEEIDEKFALLSSEVEKLIVDLKSFNFKESA